MKVLVLGGSGYIGYLMVKVLSHLCYQVTTFDELFSGCHYTVLKGDFV
jgi:UDP-glucose 4-epimerase